MNELEKRAKKHKRKQKGMSPFTTLTGDPKINSDRFNSAMSTNTSSTTTTAPVASGGCSEGMSVEEALEALNSVETDSTLVETSTSRIYDHITKPDDWAIISPYRSEYSETENRVRMTHLKSEVRELGYGYIQFVSRWVENGEAFDEQSLFIPKMVSKEAVELGKEYEQSSIIVKDSNGAKEICTTEFEHNRVGDVVRVFNTSGNSVMNISDAKEIFAKRKMGPASKAIKGGVPFHLSEVFELEQPRASYFQGGYSCKRIYCCESASITESSVNRIKQHIENGSPMAFISAYRDEKSVKDKNGDIVYVSKTKQENEKDDKELRSFARQVRFEIADGIKSLSEIDTATKELVGDFGFMLTMGGWVDDAKDSMGISEMSICLITSQEREKELFDFAVAMGIRYEQDAVLLVPHEGDAYFYSTNTKKGWANPNGKIGHIIKLGRNIYRNMDVFKEIGGFTQVKRKKHIGSTKNNVSNVGNPNQIFSIGENFHLEELYDVKSISMPNRYVAYKLRDCLKKYGKDFIEKYEESFK